MIENKSPGISFQMVDIYSVCMDCLNTATKKWTAYNLEAKLLSFVLRFYLQPTIAANVLMLVKI